MYHTLKNQVTKPYFKRKVGVNMSIRKQCNRYKTEPFGTCFEDVLKRAKAFYKNGTFYISKYGNTYTALRPSIAFKDPSDAIYFVKQNGRWIKK